MFETKTMNKDWGIIQKMYLISESFCSRQFWGRFFSENKLSCNFVCHSLDFVIIIFSKKVSHWLGHGRSGSGVQWLSKEYLTILWIEIPVPQNSTKKASFNNMILITFLKNRYELRIDPNTSIRFPSSPSSPRVFSCFRNLSKQIARVVSFSSLL